MYLSQNFTILDSDRLSPRVISDVVTWMHKITMQFLPIGYELACIPSLSRHVDQIKAGARLSFRVNERGSENLIKLTYLTSRYLTPQLGIYMYLAVFLFYRNIRLIALNIVQAPLYTE